MTRALILAIESGNLFLLKCLAFGGADLHNNFNGHSSLLHAALQFRQYDIVEYLLDCGLDINFIDHTFGTPLMAAISFNNQEFIDLLLRRGADGSIEACGETALKIAIKKKNMNVIKYLLDAGVPVNVLGPDHGNELYRVNDIEIATILLNHGVDPNNQFFNGETPLVNAVRKNNIPLIKLLLDHKADPNIKLNNGDNLAFCFRSIEALDLLLEAGLDTNVQDHEGKTCLHYSSSLCSYDRISLNTRDPYNRLHLIPHDDTLKVIHKLLTITNPNIQDHTGQTPLHCAVQTRNLVYIKLLLDHHADPELVNLRKETPLHIAIQIKDFEMCQALLEHGAQISDGMISNLDGELRKLFEKYEVPIKVTCEE